MRNQDCPQSANKRFSSSFESPWDINPVLRTKCWFVSNLSCLALHLPGARWEKKQGCSFSVHTYCVEVYCCAGAVDDQGKAAFGACSLSTDAKTSRQKGTQSKRSLWGRDSAISNASGTELTVCQQYVYQWDLFSIDPESKCFYIPRGPPRHIQHRNIGQNTWRLRQDFNFRTEDMSPVIICAAVWAPLTAVLQVNHCYEWGNGFYAHFCYMERRCWVWATVVQFWSERLRGNMSFDQKIQQRAYDVRSNGNRRKEKHQCGKQESPSVYCICTERRGNCVCILAHSQRLEDTHIPAQHKYVRQTIV